MMTPQGMMAPMMQPQVMMTPSGQLVQGIRGRSAFSENFDLLSGIRLNKAYEKPENNVIVILSFIFRTISKQELVESRVV